MADPFIAEIRIFPFNFAPQGWAWCDGQLLPLVAEHRAVLAAGHHVRRRRQVDLRAAQPAGPGADAPGQGPGLSPPRSRRVQRHGDRDPAAESRSPPRAQRDAGATDPRTSSRRPPTACSAGPTTASISTTRPTSSRWRRRRCRRPAAVSRTTTCSRTSRCTSTSRCRANSRRALTWRPWPTHRRTDPVVALRAVAPARDAELLLRRVREHAGRGAGRRCRGRTPRRRRSCACSSTRRIATGASRGPARRST